MKLLFIADVVGKIGRNAVREIVPDLKESGLDFVISNGENAAGGLGITPKLANELFEAGVNVITSGNHILRRKEIIPFLGTEKRILRPANLPSRTPGSGWGIYKIKDAIKIAVVNLLGWIFIEGVCDPVECIDNLLTKELEGIKNIIIDFHAEATAEKGALLRYLDGRVTALIGTHTHVQTSDATVTSRGTAFITDAGMTGPVDSVIGMDPDVALIRLKTNIPQKFRVAKGEGKLEGVIVNFDPETGKSSSIEPVRIACKK